MTTKTIYVSIGNSDDKLSQREWSQYCADVEDAITAFAAQIRGAWCSPGTEPWQNACWCFEAMPGGPETADFRKHLADIAAHYRQDSIAWAEATTEFITPPGTGSTAGTSGGSGGGDEPVLG